MKKRFLGVRNFIQPGRSGFSLYAVTLKDLPGVVKVGRTIRWSSRRLAYAQWNLRSGDGIDDEVVFEINEEWVDLERLEGMALGSMPFPLRHGNEWYHGDIQTAAEVIGRLLESEGLCFTERVGLAGKVRN